MLRFQLPIVTVGLLMSATSTLALPTDVGRTADVYENAVRYFAALPEELVTPKQRPEYFATLVQEAQEEAVASANDAASDVAETAQTETVADETIASLQTAPALAGDGSEDGVADIGAAVREDHAVASVDVPALVGPTSNTIEEADIAIAAADIAPIVPEVAPEVIIAESAPVDPAEDVVVAAADAIEETTEIADIVAEDIASATADTVASEAELERRAAATLAALGVVGAAEQDATFADIDTSAIDAARAEIAAAAAAEAEARAAEEQVRLAEAAAREEEAQRRAAATLAALNSGTGAAPESAFDNSAIDAARAEIAAAAAAEREADVVADVAADIEDTVTPEAEIVEAIAETDPAQPAAGSTRQVAADEDVAAVEEDSDDMMAEMADLDENLVVRDGGEDGFDTMMMSSDVLFSFGQSELAEASFESLSAIGKMADQIAVIEVFGHTDAIGSEGNNLRLGQERAEVVRDWLLANSDFTEDRVIATGVGEVDPVADNTLENGEDNPEGRALNRRVEFAFHDADYTPE